MSVKVRCDWMGVWCCCHGCHCRRRCGSSTRVLTLSLWRPIVFLTMLRHRRRQVMISRMFAEFEQRKKQLESRDAEQKKKAKEEQAEKEFMEALKKRCVSWCWMMSSALPISARSSPCPCRSPYPSTSNIPIPPAGSRYRP